MVEAFDLQYGRGRICEWDNGMAKSDAAIFVKEGLSLSTSRSGIETIRPQADPDVGSRSSQSLTALSGKHEKRR